MLKFVKQKYCLYIHTQPHTQMPDHTNELNKSEHSDNCLKILSTFFKIKKLVLNAVTKFY